MRFIAEAAGIPAPSVRWQVSRDNGHRWTAVAGAGAATLSVRATAAKDGNRYRAVFTNRAGTATTASATLRVATGCRGQPATTFPVGTPHVDAFGGRSRLQFRH